MQKSLLWFFYLIMLLSRLRCVYTIVNYRVSNNYDIHKIKKQKLIQLLPWQIHKSTK